MARIPLTLCILHQDSRVLLGMKKRGFGAGRWNGFGGKLNEGETILEAARREFKEEAGIEIGDLEEMGILDFSFEGKPDVLEVHIFKAETYEGEIGETEEMRPQWFHTDDIPFASMWEDDIHWFPLFLEGKKFRGRFLFDDVDKIVERQLEELEK
jgi:8-oxo-dGTP diphosphatase/2-hydroxy-dATP diphosphatase